MGKEILFIPEDHLEEVIEIIRNGLEFTNASEHIEQYLKQWCDEAEENLSASA